MSHAVSCVGADELSSALPGDRVLTLRRERHGLRLALASWTAPIVARLSP